MSREKSKRKPRKDESTKAGHRGGVARSSDEGAVMALEQRGGIVQFELREQLETGGLTWNKQSCTSVWYG